MARVASRSADEPHERLGSETPDHGSGLPISARETNHRGRTDHPARSPPIRSGIGNCSAFPIRQDFRSLNPRWELGAAKRRLARTFQAQGGEE